MGHIYVWVINETNNSLKIVYNYKKTFKPRVNNDNKAKKNSL